jgi:hypothetical protein
MIVRIVNVVLIVAMVAGAVVTYNLKHQTEKAANRVARLHAGIAKEHEAIAFLKAEWSMLSQPARLQQLIARYQEHFKLEPFAANQVATLDEIPIRPGSVAPETGVATVADAAAGVAAVGPR